MAHYGIIAPAVFGHFNPMATLGRELISRGNRVTFIGVPDIEEKTRNAGLEYRVIGEQEFPPGTIAESMDTLGRLAGRAALKFTIDWYVRSTETVLAQCPDIFRELQIDAHITDQTTAFTGSAAEMLDLPWVSVCNALIINRHSRVPPFATAWKYRDTWSARLRNRFVNWMMDRAFRPVFKVRDRYRREWGLPVDPDPFAVHTMLAGISQQPPMFEFPRSDLPPMLHFVGPLRDERSQIEVDFPFDQLDERPLVYASMGTLQNRVPAVFRKVAEACATLDVQLVITVGGKKEGVDDLPGDPIVVEFAPQLELIRRATLVITHAGLNTTLDALSHGVPLVAIPVTNEQPGIGARIEHVGAGRVVPYRKLTAERLRDAVATVLGNGSFRESAKRLRDDIESAGGVKRAADIIAQAVQTREPVLNPAMQS